MIERVFLDWSEPALPRAAAVLLDHYAAEEAAHTPPGGPVRLDGAVVAVPGGRAGRRLKELLVEEGRRRGRALVPPRITTMGAVPELLYSPDRPVAEDAVARRVWAEVLEATDVGALDAVFPRRPEAGALAEWARLGREVHGLHRMVAAGGLRFEDVAARCGGAPLFDDRSRWRVLAGLQRAYQARLEALGYVDRDLARLAALDRGEVRPGSELWLVGVSEMPEVLRRFVIGAARSDPVRALVHAPEARADAFDALGCVVPAAWRDAAIPIDEDRLHVVDQPSDQAEGVARVLHALDGEFAADDIVVGVPDPAVVPFLEQRLGSAGVPTREAAGTPVGQTAPFHLLRAVADYLDGRRYEALAALARHPDVGEWLTRLDGWLGALDRYHNEHLQARITGSLPGPGRPDGDRAVVAGLVTRLDDELLARFRDPAPMSHRAGAVIELLADVYGARELSGDRPSDRRLARALGTLGRTARSFLQLPDDLDVPCGAADALRLILEEATGESVPAEADRAAVELLGWLELHLDDAPVTVVTGVNEPYLPDSVSAHPFLPDGLRRVLGLLDNERRYARDAYQLTAMLHATPHLALVAGRRTETGDPVRPSRLLFAADPDVAARRVRRFYDEEYAGSDDEGPAVAGPETPETPETPATPASGARSRFILPPEPVISAPEPLTRLRATDFSALIADPYRFALDRILGLEAIDDAAREMDALRFGSLAHRVLERFGRSDAVNEPDPEAARARLDELLDAEVRRRFGTDTYVAARVQVDQLRARLHAFADWHAGWIGGGWEVVAVECATPPGGVPLDVDGVPMGISARIDRVDYHAADDVWAVFDYKTSERGRGPDDTHRTNRGSEWADLQLPLYRWILPQLQGEDGAPLAPGATGGNTRVGYIKLPRELDDVGADIAPWPEPLFADALDRARELVRLVRENRFEYDPERRSRYPDPALDALLGIGQLRAATHADTGEDG